MFSMITNISNKKTKRPTLMEFFTAIGKLRKFFLTTRHVRCVHHRWQGTHWYNMSRCQHVDTRVNMLTRVWQEPEYREKFHYGRSSSFLVRNVCNQGEHYETPCIMRVNSKGFLMMVHYTSNYYISRFCPPSHIQEWRLFQELKFPSPMLITVTGGNVLSH